MVNAGRLVNELFNSHQSELLTQAIAEHINDSYFIVDGTDNPSYSIANGEYPALYSAELLQVFMRAIEGHTEVERLTFMNYRLENADSVIPIAEGLKNPKLSSIEFFDINLMNTGNAVDVMLDSLVENPHITTFKLSDRGLNNKAAMFGFAKRLGNTNVQSLELTLGHEPLTQDAAEGFIAGSEGNVSLRHLSLRGNRFCLHKSAAQTLISGIPKTAITSLDCTYSLRNAEDFELVLDALKTSTIDTIILRDTVANNRDNAIGVIANVINETPVKAIDLRDNQLNDSNSSESLLRLARENPTLDFIGLDGNPLSDGLLLALNNTLYQNANQHSLQSMCTIVAMNHYAEHGYCIIKGEKAYRVVDAATSKEVFAFNKSPEDYEAALTDDLQQNFDEHQQRTKGSPFEKASNVREKLSRNVQRKGSWEERTNQKPSSNITQR